LEILSEVLERRKRRKERRREREGHTCEYVLEEGEVTEGRAVGDSGTKRPINFQRVFLVFVFCF
jgi:hypothetical protein